MYRNAGVLWWSVVSIETIAFLSVCAMSAVAVFDYTGQVFGKYQVVAEWTWVALLLSFVYPFWRSHILNSANNTGLRRRMNAPIPQGWGSVAVSDESHLFEVIQREYGNLRHAARIWQFNEGRIQLDGHAMTRPDRLRPSWIIWLPSKDVPDEPMIQ